MPHLLAEYIVWFFVYAFIGWCWEVVLSFAKHRTFINRGFVTGPVLPIYGAGALVAIVVLHPISNPAVQFFAACATAVVLEYGTSWAMERIFHARWWDYADDPLNLNGRICLAGIILFGVAMVFVDRVAQPTLASLTGQLNPVLLTCVATLVVAAFIVDLVRSIVNMNCFNEQLAELQGRICALAQQTRKRTMSAVENARKHAGETCESAAEQGRGATEGRLREILANRSVPLRYFERRTLRDPYFSSTRFREASELLRQLVRRTKE